MTFKRTPAAADPLLAATTVCRVCGNLFDSESLLSFRNMPGAAQHLPDVDSVIRDRGVDLDVYQCSGCGLVQLSNPPVSYYREVIRAVAFSPEMRSFREEQFRNFVSTYALDGKKVLEIGCGRGEYLDLMQQAGVDAYGIEDGADAVEQCTRGGLKVVRSFIRSADQALADAPFDAFFMLNFLEHLPDPNATLKGIAHNLSADAVGLLEVPNFDMILRNRLFSEFIGDHLFYFTRETLRTTLSLNGFEVIECNDVWHEYILSLVVKKRTQLDITDFADYQSRLSGELQHFIDRFEVGKVAIWGAGHQALAILALTGIAGRIRYVVDSAPFKQGKFTPATHVPIVSPETLSADPVDAVIVMAASYSDEVASILRARHGTKITISVVRDFGLEQLQDTCKGM